MLAFPVSEVPEMPRGKGNKLYDIPSKKAAARTEMLTGIAVVAPKGKLMLRSGEKEKILDWSELKDYRGQRAQRGSVLTRGWRQVDRLESVTACPLRRTLGVQYDLFGRVHEIALDVLHAQLPQHRHGVGILDALGDRLTLRRRRFHQVAHAFLHLRVLRQSLDECAVDLDEIELDI
jgi:hypothetical protein